jgi:hypothetical protein
MGIGGRGVYTPSTGNNIVNLGALLPLSSHTISLTFVDGHVLTYTFSFEVKCGISSTIT